MPKLAQNTKLIIEKNNNAPVAVQPLNNLKGGSYIKDPITGKRTLVQETKRATPKPTNAEK